jgi:hypothetical protein
MKTNAMHHLKKSFILTIGLLACALHQPAMALSLGYLNTVTNLDLSTSSLTDTVFTVCSTNSTLTNTIVIGVGQELRINGNVLFGTNIMTSTSAIVTMSGEGNFNVNTNGGTFQIGRNLSTIGVGATLDMGALAVFNANLGSSGVFTVSANCSGTVDAGMNPNPPPTLILATNSSITAGTLYVGSGGESTLQYLKLGYGSNTLNANNFYVGGGKASGRVMFNTSSGIVTMRGAGGGDTRANLIIASSGGNSVSISGTNDFSRHSADLRLDQLTIGVRAGSNASTPYSTGALFFDTGTLDVNTVLLGSSITSGKQNSLRSYGSLSVTGGVAVINFGMIIATNDASRTSVATGTFLVGGMASVVVSNSVGVPAITLGAVGANATNTAGANATLTVEGGTLRLFGDLTHGNDGVNGAHGTAIVNLTGGTLLMPSYAIVSVDNFTMTNAMLAVGVYSGLPVLVNRGTGILAPGGTNVVGSTIVSNSYVQVSPATLDIDLVSRLNYDRVTVTGTVTLAGTINVRASSAATGDFDILTSEVSVSDTSTLDAGAVAAGFKKTLVNAGKTVRISRHPATFIYFL